MLTSFMLIAVNEQRLRYFVAVAEEGNMTRAAAQLALTQPALSQQIQLLEQELGATLFERSRRGVVLTSAGEALLPYARRLIAQFREARLVVEELSGFQRGQLTVGVVQSVNITLMPQVVANFRERYPKVALKVLELASDRVTLELLRGNLDIGIGFIWGSEDNVISEPLFREEMLLVVPKGHPLYGRMRVAVAELDGARMVSVMPGSKRIWDHCCVLAGIHTDEVAEMSSIASVIASVSYMQAATVAPAMALVGTTTPLVRGVPLVEPKPERTVGCLWRQRQYRSQLSRDLATMVRTAVQRLNHPYITALAPNGEPFKSSMA